MAACSANLICGSPNGRQHRKNCGRPATQYCHLCSSHLPILWCRGHCTGYPWAQLQGERRTTPTHSTVNNIIQRTLSTAGVPYRLEPPGLLRSDDKRPDGMTLVPWRSGRLFVWDATCPDTYAVSYRGQATTEVGYVAAHGVETKSGKYSHPSPTYLFHPVVIESSGALGPSTYIF